MDVEARLAEVEAQQDPRQPLERFEALLSERTKVPAERLADFIAWNEDKVRHEAKVVGRVLRRFADAVVRSMEDPDSMQSFLTELDLKVISRDHDWRAIFSGIRERRGIEATQYKRAVLIKYLQYLSFRKRLLDFIHARKAGLEETDELSSDLTRVPDPAGSRAASAPRRPAAQAVPAELFDRMPLGEAVEVLLGEDDVLEFFLARHRFELVGGPRPFVVDDNGVTCFVRPGRNIVGRHPESDLSVDANFSDVSRAHMVLEWDGARRFRLVDLSSRGTWLRREVLTTACAVSGPEDLMKFF